MEDDDLEVLDCPGTPEPSEHTLNSAIELVPFDVQNNTCRIISIILFYNLINLILSGYESSQCDG
jgi:hypothetical protein